MSIGLFDSGVGGLSVLGHVRAAMPNEHLIYIADQAHVPYGSRTLDKICQLSVSMTNLLLEQGSKLIVVACNTATGAALSHLRQTFPSVPFVGMEPAVKPAAAQTKNGRIGVLATPGTLRSQRYATLLARFASHIIVWEDPCLGLVEQIEAGQLDTPKTEQLLRGILQPMLAEGVDTIVLGCTHYPFVLPVIERVLGELGKTAVSLIDPAPAIARQTQRLLTQHNLATTRTCPGQVQLLTTGNPNNLAPLAAKVLGMAIDVESLYVETS